MQINYGFGAVIPEDNDDDARHEKFETETESDRYTVWKPQKSSPIVKFVSAQVHNSSSDLQSQFLQVFANLGILETF